MDLIIGLVLFISSIGLNIYLFCQVIIWKRRWAKTNAAFNVIADELEILTTNKYKQFIEGL